MKLKLPEGPFKAFLFDCDGTIVDSMPLHYRGWTKALGEWGATFTEDQFYGWGGMPVDKVISTLNEQQGLEMPIEEVADRKEGLYYELLNDLQAVPEVVEHIHASYGQMKFAVVSGSTRDSVTKSLKQLGLLDRFEVLVCAGDYAKGKPDPEPFLLAAEKLGVKPEECLVFEDAETGIQSAKAAGMAWVKVLQPHERETKS